MTTTISRRFPFRVIAFLSMQLGTAALFVFAAHLMVFLLRQDTTIVLTISGTLVILLQLVYTIKYVKKAHSWKDTAEYWATYDVDLSRRCAAASLCFLFCAATGATFTRFPFWFEICGGIALLSVSWSIIWVLAKNERA